MQSSSEDAGPLVLKGKREPVPAWRRRQRDARRAGLDAPAGLAARRPGDRADRLRGDLRRAVEQGSGELVTIMGAAGVGKSRLSAEFLAGVADGATVLTRAMSPVRRGNHLPADRLRHPGPLPASVSVTRRSEAREKLWQVLPSGPDAPLVGDRLAGLSVSRRRHRGSSRRSGPYESSSSTSARRRPSSSSSTTSSGASRRSSTCSSTSRSGSSPLPWCSSASPDRSCSNSAQAG